jgi:two-component system, OmpR family, response regulator ChvI
MTNIVYEAKTPVDRSSRSSSADLPLSLGGEEHTKEVQFLRSQNCCVCFVDIMDSTRVTSSINNAEKIRKYYETFLNTMAAIARNFGAKIIKNVGDCLILSYPKTSGSLDISAFNDVLECCITMIEARNTINQKMHEEELPSISYRISAEYGRVEVARSATSQSDDLFGPVMNMCSKINSKALPNGIAIGDGLYKVIQSLSLLSFKENRYHLQEIAGLEHQQTDFNKYPLYSLQRNNPITSSSRSDWQEQQKQEQFRNILLIDDEEDILYTFKQGLASEGHNVEAFVDPMEAFAHFVNVNPSHYNLAILDIRMPGLNGLQLYYRLKAINRNIKILFVSALDAVQELISILPDVKTANDFIKKPVALDDFISAVRTAIAR